MTTVLFTRSDSVYLSLDCDCWDIHRNARNYSGSGPVIAHPPCRQWGRFKNLAHKDEGEKELARAAVRYIRFHGGVLEHPENSSLWQQMGMPLPGRGHDVHMGWTLSVDQSWWGHRARKRTWLYIVGVGPKSIPPWPLRDEPVTRCVAPSKKNTKGLKTISKKERDATPLEFAKYLISIVELIKSKK